MQEKSFVIIRQILTKKYLPFIVRYFYGGDGKNYISDQERQEICQYYLTVGQVKLTAQHFSHSEDTISRILKENDIKVNYVQKNEIEMRDLKTKAP